MSDDILREQLRALVRRHSFGSVERALDEINQQAANTAEADDEPAENCAHEWIFTGTAYGGEDSRWHGEGRCFCAKCGADGDA